ncbi:MAG TPA: hypothetical protein VIG69_16955 [Candidatus Methylomirabilis sp.]
MGHPAPAAGAQFVPVAAAVHVHTTFSTGTEDLDAVVRRARAAGLRALLFTENYDLRFEYGFRPLDGIIRWRERFPSLAPGGLPAYLEAVRRGRERHPDMILIPGLEVIPFYYWTGSLLDGSLTMHDGQKNLLVFGLERAEDLHALPVVGNGRPLRAAQWPLRLSPLALAGAGVWLFRLRRVRHTRWRQFRIRREVHYRWAGTALVALALLLALDGVLAGNHRWRPEGGPRGYTPHQAAIDSVVERGGAAVWSMPEARDFGVHRRAGATVTIRTEPYPEALAATRGYTAFGALYADTTAVEAPGGLWDQLLLEFQAGRRRGWPVAIGETAFHVAGQAGKRLEDVQTVFLAAAPTPAAILEALRAGRAYAHIRVPELALVLEGFAVNGAGLGETARAVGGSPPRIALAVAASDGKAHPVEVRLIRNGAVLAERKGATPLTLDLEDREAPLAGPWYYRVDVKGERGARLLTNPIFVAMGG